MATIEKRYNRAGEFTHYRITIFFGSDSSGTPIRHRMNWTPDANMTQRQVEKAVQTAASKFEDEIKNGYQTDTNVTFEEYAEYVLKLKIRAGLAPRTVDRYRSFLTRINPAIGYLKITDIRPSHLNNFYEELSKDGSRNVGTRAIPKPALANSFKRAGIPKCELAKRAHCADSTIRAALEGRPVMKETADKIAEALNKRFSELFRIQYDSGPLADKTILEHHRLVSTILHQAEKEMLVMYNAASKATPPKHKRSKPDYFQPEELDEILTALENAPLKWKAATYVLIDTGCRRGELMGLTWDCVDLDEGILTIEKALLYAPSKGVYLGPPKNDRVRAVKIAPETLALLKAQKASQEEAREVMGDQWVESGFVFTRSNGDRMDPSSIAAWLAKFSLDNGLPHIHPHAFRHTAASNMIASGIDLVATAAELGHVNATTTATIYAHQIAVASARAAEVRGGVFRHRTQSSEDKQK